jgi:hypothetical protein
MNCKTAQRLIESCRPSGDDLNWPELAPAAAHLEGCPDCLSRFRLHQATDARIAAVMQDVPIPDGLRGRIEARLRHTDQGRRVRRLAGWSVAAALLIGATVALWQQTQTLNQPVAVQPTGEWAIQTVERAPDADVTVPGDLRDAASVAAWCTKQLAKFGLNVRASARLPLSGLVGIARTTVEGRAVAVFQYDDSRGPVDLLALPLAEFDVGSAASSPQVWQTRNLVVVTWTEGETAYVAVLKNWSRREWQQLVPRTGGVS